MVRLIVLLLLGLLVWPSLQNQLWVEACFKVLLAGSVWMIWRRYTEGKASKTGE